MPATLYVTHPAPLTAPLSRTEDAQVVPSPCQACSGVGHRYRARYIAPDGSEKSKSFPDKRKRKADQWLANIEADMSQGRYIDPAAGWVTFGEYAKKWMAALTIDPVTHESVEIRLRVHALPYLGDRPMASFRPSHLRAWMRELEATGRAASYPAVGFRQRLRSVHGRRGRPGHR
jgi:hypothetical protein